MTVSAGPALGWCITGLFGGGNTSTMAMKITSSEIGQASRTSHFSSASSPASALEGSLDLECIISWRLFWLEFEVKHESGNLERKTYLKVWLIGIMQRQSQMFQHKGDLLTTSLYHPGLKCLRRDDSNPYTSTSYLHLEFQCRNNMTAFAGQEWPSSLRVFALYPGLPFSIPCMAFSGKISI